MRKKKWWRSLSSHGSHMSGSLGSCKFAKATRIVYLTRDEPYLEILDLSLILLTSQATLEKLCKSGKSPGKDVGPGAVPWPLEGYSSWREARAGGRHRRISKIII